MGPAGCFSADLRTGFLEFGGAFTKAGSSTSDLRTGFYFLGGVLVGAAARPRPPPSKSSDSMKRRSELFQIGRFQKVDRRTG